MLRNSSSPEADAYWRAVPADAPADVAAWSVGDVCEWLRMLRCESEQEAFRKHHVSGAVLMMLDTPAELLDTLNVASLGHRKIIELARDWLATNALGGTTARRHHCGRARSDHPGAGCRCSHAAAARTPPLAAAGSLLNSPAKLVQGAAAQLQRVEQAWADLTGANVSQGHHGAMKLAFMLFGALSLAIVLPVLVGGASPWFLLWAAFPLLTALRCAVEHYLHTCVLSGVGGLCTFSAARAPNGLAGVLRLEGQFRRRALGAAVSFAVPKRGLSLNERKGLRMRAQIYYLYVFLAWLTIANVVGLLWAMLTPAVGCNLLLTTKSSGCKDIDPTAVVAVVGGAVSLWLTVRQIFVFVNTPLTKMPEEQDGGGCVLNNAGPNHQKAMSTLYKVNGFFVIGFELLVAIIPLPPYWYLLVAGPAMFSGMASAQKYFKGASDAHALAWPALFLTSHSICLLPQSDLSPQCAKPSSTRPVPRPLLSMGSSRSTWTQRCPRSRRRSRLLSGHC